MIMFRKYGLLGVALILFAELALFFRISPFATYLFFPFVWFGYILTVDAIVYMVQDKSLLTKRPLQFFSFILISIAVWWAYELFNIFMNNWHYISISGTIGTAAIFSLRSFVLATIAFSTVLPAVMETVWLIKAIHLFDDVKLKRQHRISKGLLYSMIAVGIICLALPVISPTYFFPLVWLGFFFLLDPINYFHKQPSTIGHLKDQRLKTPLSLLLAGFLCGFFWEMWNFYALIKWQYSLPLIYSIPYIGSIKIFEMPILGYFGYGPFALSLYAIWKFFKSLSFKMP